MASITRVGLVAKARLDAAAGVLAELAGWLDARGVQPVFETETAALVGLPPGRSTRKTASRSTALSRIQSRRTNGTSSSGCVGS